MLFRSGAVTHAHHGAACALALPYVVYTQAEALPEKVRKIGIAMGIEIPVGTEHVGQLVSQHIHNFNTSLNVNNLSQFGIKAKDIDKIVEYSCSYIMMSIAHRRAKPDELRDYLMRNL